VIGDALESVFSMVEEVEFGPSDKVTNGSGDEYFTSVGEGSDPGGDVYCKPGEIAAAAFALAGMKAYANGEA